MKKAKIIIAALLAMLPFAANAIPIQLNEVEFGSAIAGLSTQVEDFEGISTTWPGSPFTFSNGTYTSFNPVVIDDQVFCGTASDTCLASQIIFDDRSFSGLPANTKYWGVDMYYIQPSDLINVIVTGGSGVLNISQVGTSFFGFYDSLGISSITFRNLASPNGSAGNYSFDNITTAQIPEPGTLALLGIGLFGMGLAKRRKTA